MKRLIGLLLFLLWLNSVLAQPNPDTLWTRTFGGAGNDWPYGGIIETVDGGYVVAGSLNLSTDSLSGYIMRMSSNGDSVWTRQFPGVGFYSIIRTSDGGFVLAGGFGLWSAHSSDAFAMRIDDNGETSWTVTFGGTDNDRLVCIAERPDGHFALGGYSMSFSTDSNLDYYLALATSAGDTVWTRAWGGTDSDVIADLVGLSTGELVLGGWTRSSSAGEADYCLQKTDSVGALIWSRTYGTYQNEIGRSLCMTVGGGFLLVGTHAESSGSDPVAFALRTDQDGDSIWARSFGTNFQSSTSYDVVRIDNEDAYVMCGNYSDGSEVNAWLVRLDAQGDTVWTRRYGPSGANNVESALALNRTSSGGYVLAGIYWDLNGQRGTDFYVIKTGPEILSADEHFSILPNSFSLSVYPNPFNSQATLTLHLPRPERAEVVMYDVLGRVVRTVADRVFIAGEHRLIVDGGGLPSGLYFVRVYQPIGNHAMALQKVVVMK